MDFHLEADKVSMVPHGGGVHGVYPYMIFLRRLTGVPAMGSHEPEFEAKFGLRPRSQRDIMQSVAGEEFRIVAPRHFDDPVKNHEEKTII
jgi:hypothetical protein